MLKMKFNQYTDNLGYQNEYLVYVSETCYVSEKVNIIYFLHGLSENHLWIENFDVEKATKGTNTILIAVNAHNSYYLNTIAGEKFKQYIGVELHQKICEKFKFTFDKKYIIGVSMGGYGAMLIGLTYDFCAIATLSGSVMLENRLKNVTDNRFYRLIKEVPNQYSIEKLLLKEKNKEKNIYCYCGTNDFLYTDNLIINEIIKKRIRNYKIVSDEGDHNLEYWKPHFFKAIHYMIGGSDEHTTN